MAYILQNLTIAALNNNKMLSELQNHILDSRKQYNFNPRSPLQTFFRVMRASDLFFASKTVSIEPGITALIMRRDNHLTIAGILSFTPRLPIPERKPLRLRPTDADPSECILCFGRIVVSPTQAAEITGVIIF